jgi:hypothetical protein
MSLTNKAIDQLPRGFRRYLRHAYTVGTGKLHRNHHEMSERDDFFRKAMKMLAYNGISGDYAEFGCHGGMTMRMAHSYMRKNGVSRHLWAFDSFSGFPPPEGEEDEHPMWVQGEMKTSLDNFVRECRRNGIGAHELTTVPGYYSDTLEKRKYTGPLPDDIALAYVDCDLFSSTASVFGFLKPRLKHGMIIAFDDYFCYSATALAGERAAMLAFLKTEDRFEFADYQPFGWHGMSFIVEDKGLLERVR